MYHCLYFQMQEEITSIYIITDLQSVNQFLLNGVLGGGVGGHTQPLRSLPQPLLLVLILWVRCCTLRTHTHVDQQIQHRAGEQTAGMSVERSTD